MKTGQWLVNVFSVARMEFRTTQRLPRFWEIASISSATCIGAYTTACLFLIYIAPSYVPFVTATPKYLLSNIDPSMFLLLQLALLFLVFDTNHRHNRARIAEVLDSRPITNLESLVGRIIGIPALLWLVVTVNVLVLHCFGLLCQVFGFGFAEPLQAHSIFNLLVLDVPANLLIWCALIVFLSSAFRSRLAVFAISVLLMLAYYFLMLRTPFSLLPVLSPSTNDSLYISDIVPEIASLPTIFVRIASMIGALLLIVLATLFTTRWDGSSRLANVVVASVLFLVTGMLVSLAIFETTDKFGQIAKWRESHESYLWNGGANVAKISGDVHIDPGQHLVVDLILTFDDVSPQDGKMVFTFNPGMTIQQLSLNEQPAEFSFKNGLLEISTPSVLEDRVVHSLGIKAEGVPNPRFAYLNSALDYQSDPEIRPRTVKLFGTEGSIYSRRYVGLMPSVYWYPIPGPIKGGSSAANMEQDYFNVDLTVALARPNWNVVASGAIPEYIDGKYTVATNMPVSQFGLLASNFEKVTLDIDGIEFSITLHERHAKNLVLAEDLDEVIRSQIRLILNPLAEDGFSYPSKFLNLVEVPSRLRTVGGGWRMDTTNTLPGIVLLKEHGYPTAPIHRTMDVEKYGYSGDEIKGGQVRMVFLFFQHSVGPDNPWTSFPHRYWTHVTAASGKYAKVIDQSILSILSQLTFTWDFFSIYSTLYVGDMVVPNPFSGYVSADPFERNRGGAPQLFRLGDIEAEYSVRPSVWGHVESNSLAVLPSHHGSQKDIEHLLLKSAEIAKGLEALNGRSKILTWLAAVRSTYAGSTFTHSDLLELAERYDVIVEPFLTEWITADEVPGYVLASPSAMQVSDDEQGSSRFQTTFEIRNVQPTSGYIQFQQFSAGFGRWPVLMNGQTSKRINLVTSSPPSDLYLETGLSLNRGTISFDRQTEDGTGGIEVKGQLAESPAEFEQNSDWVPSIDGIIVDDLDPGFQTFQKNPLKKRTNMPYLLGGLFEPSLRIELDHGLPIWSWNREDRLVGIWQRSEHARAYGVFRKTYAFAWNRNGLPTSRFSAELPSTGKWHLEYHIPERFVSWNQLVDYDLALENDGVSFDFVIEAGTMGMGWNSIQTFTLKKGNVALDIVGSPTSTTLYADAIRWTRVEPDPLPKSN